MTSPITPERLAELEALESFDDPEGYGIRDKRTGRELIRINGYETDANHADTKTLLGMRDDLIARIRELEAAPLAHSQATRVAEAAWRDGFGALATGSDAEAWPPERVDAAVRAVVARALGEDPVGKAERVFLDAARRYDEAVASGHVGLHDANEDEAAARLALIRAREAGR